MQKSSKQFKGFSFLSQRLSDPNAVIWWPIISLLVLGTALRLYQIGTESIWVDENFSIRDAENLKLGTRPLYYLLLRFWMFFGTSDTWLRLFSLPFSVASILLTYLIGSKVASRSIGLIAAFLMTISPLFVGYAQEIRMYALSTFLTLWGTLELIDALEETRKNALRSWIIARCLAILTTPLNLFLLLADLILVGWKFRQQKQRFRQIGKGLILIAVLWLPFAYVLMTVMSRFMEGWVAYQRKPDILLIPSILTVFTTFWPITDLPKLNELNLSLEGWGTPETTLAFYMIYTLITVFLFAIGILQVIAQVKQKVSPPKLLWVAIWCLLPSLFILIVSYTGGSIWRDRYLMFVAPYYLILLSVGFQQVWQYYRPIGLGIALIYFMAVSNGLTHYYTTNYHDDWKGIAQLIEANEKPGDKIGFYAPDWEPHLALPRYYKGSASFHVMSDEGLPRPPEETPVFISKILNNLPGSQSNRYWLVVYEPWSRGLSVFKTIINQQYNVIRYQNFPSSVNSDQHVFLVEPRPTPQTVTKPIK